MNHCSNCGVRITGDVCDGCGESARSAKFSQPKATTSYWKVFGPIAGLTIAAMFFTANLSDDSSPSRNSSPVVSVSPATVVADYEENELYADEKYKGRRLVIVGKVASIGRESAGSPYVSIDAGHELWNVRCVFAGDPPSKLRYATRGSNVVVGGACVGKRGDVILTDCVIQ